MIREMTAAEIVRVAEIDRSEHVTRHYRVAGGEIQAEAVDWQVPRWPVEGTGPHSVAEKIAAWRPLVESGSVLLGASDEERLAGVAILRFRLTKSMAQLAVLYVSRAYRRQRIGQRLVAEVIRRARADSARALYVSATPTGSAVGFYQALGFELAPQPHPELYEQEPEDIHMILRLA
jgi:ribosomal protein S18 acetylase RimI-like enzyme